MASTKAPRRISVAPRLFLVGAKYYIRVRVPRDLQGSYRTEGRGAWEVFEPLNTIDRREADRRCRARGAEIDAEFLVRRKRATAGGAALTTDAMDQIAHRVYQHELAKLEGELNAKRAAPSWDCNRWLDHKDYQRGEWLEELSENEWLEDTNDRVEVALLKEGFTIPRSSPAFADVRLRMARAVIAALEVAIERAKGDYGFVASDPIATSAPTPQASQGVTLGTLIDNYKNDRGASWSTKTADGYTLIFRALKELLGEGTQVKGITPDDCRRVRDVLFDLAPNYTKLAATRDKPMDEAAKISRALDLPRRQPGTVNSYLNNLAALFNFAVEKWYVDRSPAKGLQLPVLTKKKDKKKPFDRDQLKAIFSAPLYTGCKNDEGGYATPGPNVPRRGRFWVPLLSLWSGMRLN